MKELGAGAQLLREVGSFKGAGEKGQEPIFDLGGNVAEWIVTAGGTGRAVGGSADRPADARALAAKPGEKVAPSGAAPAYLGFRVVLDTPAAR